MKSLLILCIFLGTIKDVNCFQYSPDWPSLDSRPLPSWYDEAKIGIFMHFGPYAVPGIESEWFWMQWKNKNKNIIKYMKAFYPPNFTYQEFGKDLKAEFFNASKLARLVFNSGAKYLVFTSKHHDGFANFDSQYSVGWNSMDIGPSRNLLNELKIACAQNQIHFGLYYSLLEWFHPLYLSDKASHLKKRDFVKMKILPELKALITKYEPEILWSDGDWEASPNYWSTKQFLAWLFNESPTKDTIVTNDRWGIGTGKKHGSFYSGPDRYNPGVLQEHKWENAMTIDKESWGYRRNMEFKDVMSFFDLLRTVTQTISCGGNILINVGPTKEGSIAPIFEERLTELGNWLRVNGASIYKTSPWRIQNETCLEDDQISIWFTTQAVIKRVYGILLGWPRFPSLSFRNFGIRNSSDSSLSSYLLCDPTKNLLFHVKDQNLVLQLPSFSSLAPECGLTLNSGFVFVFNII